MPLASSQIIVAKPVNAGVDLRTELEALGRLDMHELRVVWRKLLRGMPPEHLTRTLIVKVLAYRIQAKAFGGLDRDTARYLDGIAREQVRRIKAGEKTSPKAVPPIPPVPRSRRFKPGTILVREVGGQMHAVMVIEGGFSWQGTAYRSLSEVARAITGTNWNGPRFFGLRAKAGSRSAAQEVQP